MTFHDTIFTICKQFVSINHSTSDKAWNMLFWACFSHSYCKFLMKMLILPFPSLKFMFFNMWSTIPSRVTFFRCYCLTLPSFPDFFYTIRAAKGLTGLWNSGMIWSSREQHPWKRIPSVTVWHRDCFLPKQKAYGTPIIDHLYEGSCALK